MIDLNSTQFWIAILFLGQLVLVVFLFLLSKKISTNNITSDKLHMESNNPDSNQQASEQAAKIVELLEPMMRESRKVAQLFDDQIREKRLLIKELNDSLDNRIININLLLSRAKTQYEKMVSHEQSVQSTQSYTRSNPDTPKNMTVDLQHQIIQMYENGMDMEAIAQDLSVPHGEVQMIIELKKKFLEMEQNSV